MNTCILYLQYLMYAFENVYMFTFSEDLQILESS